MPSEQEAGKKRAEADDFQESLRKTLLLKQFAVRNGYTLSRKLLDHINELEAEKIAAETVNRTGQPSPPVNGKELTSAKTKLDEALLDLTAITLPITVDTLEDSVGPHRYNQFKRCLLVIGLIGLFCATAGLVGTVLAANGSWLKEAAPSVLAISLGLLGAVVYSFFSVLGVISAQTFDRKDEYALYARLEIGVLLGWVFYFGFAHSQYQKLATDQSGSQAFYLMIPFIAGYSTKFVVGVLERVMAALLFALGIEGKKEARLKRTREFAPGASTS